MTQIHFFMKFSENLPRKCLKKLAIPCILYIPGSFFGAKNGPNPLYSLLKSTKSMILGVQSDDFIKFLKKSYIKPFNSLHRKAVHEIN